MVLPQGRGELASLLTLARSGSTAARQDLFARYRDYLDILARSLTRKTPQIRLDASDLVQQTYLEAHRDLAQFRGTVEPEFAAWLRQILVHNLAHQAESRDRLKRGGGRRVSLDDLLNRPGGLAQHTQVEPVSTPSACAIRHEQAAMMAEALRQLPEDQRTALKLHYLQELPVPEVARKMGRSTEAVTGLIYRGTRTLRGLMGQES